MAMDAKRKNDLYKSVLDYERKKNNYVPEDPANYSDTIEQYEDDSSYEGRIADAAVSRQASIERKRDERQKKAREERAKVKAREAREKDKKTRVERAKMKLKDKADTYRKSK